MSELFENKLSGASFSNDRKYRYCLWRIWDETKPLVMFIGLNPSQANEAKDDPTIKRVIAIAKHNGYGGFYMMNCWAFIATKPEDLKYNHMANKWNDSLIILTAGKCKDVVFAWGNFKIVTDMGRDKELKEVFPNALALCINKNGSPKHPLYCRADTTLIPFTR